MTLDLLYTTVYCDDSNCAPYYQSVAESMRSDSFRISAYWAIVIFMTLTGNFVVCSYFGKASEKLTKRIRDIAFISLIRQEVGFFDSINAGDLTSQLQEDTRLIQTVAGQPIQNLILSTSGFLISIIISLIFMW